MEKKSFIDEQIGANISAEVKQPIKNADAQNERTTTKTTSTMPPAYETKSERVQLLIKPSIKAALKKEVDDLNEGVQGGWKRASFNDLVNYILEEHAKQKGYL